MLQCLTGKHRNISIENSKQHSNQTDKYDMREEMLL